YLKAIAGAAPEALTEMQSAIGAMVQAVAFLEKSDRGGSLGPEEEALARLYRVLALLPELKNMPIKPEQNEQKQQKTKLAVALEEIKKQKREEEKADAEI